jgi:hypothetical protein
MRGLFSMILILSSLTMFGCTHLYSGRTYLAEMESDQSNFFTPREDFPVVSGDTGRDWFTKSERQRRTPASEAELQEDRFSRSLRNELKQLQANQSDEDMFFYNKHAHKLGTTPEKIYFLKLPPFERREYLINRGFVDSPKNESHRLRDTKTLSGKNEVLLGMKKDHVVDSIGRPTRVEIAGNPINENERWLYKLNGASRYIYFESGQVQGWE